MLREFADRGTLLNGILTKNKYGGVLLVAFFKNRNNKTQIVATAWVSGKTKENWSWFLDFHLPFIKMPKFINSDRDKGLITTTQIKLGDIPHF